MLVPRSNIGKRFLTIMAGTASSQLITIVAMPIVTRLYTPEMFGIFSVYLAFFNFCLTFTSLKYDSALLVARDEEETHQIMRVGTFFVVVMSLLAIPSLWFLNSSEILGFNLLPWWATIVCSISLLGFGLYSLYRSWLLWFKDAKVISFSAISRSAANAVVRLVSGLINSSIVGLFLAEIAGSWSSLLMARKNIRSRLKVAPPKWDISVLLSVAAKYRKFPIFEAPSSMINALSGSIQVPIVATLYGAQAAGWYGLARLLYAIPNGQIGGAVADVFQMELSECVRNKNISRGSYLFSKFTKRLALVGLIPFTFAIFVAPIITPYVFGESWSGMGVLIAYIAPWMYAALIVSSMSRALSVLQKQELKFIYDICSILLISLSFYITYFFQISLQGAIGLISGSMCFSYLIYYFVIVSAFKRYEQ